MTATFTGSPVPIERDSSPVIAAGRARRRPAAPTTIELELNLRASVLAWLLERSDARPARWDSPWFGRVLGLVRRQLAPIDDRALLAQSFDREAGRRRTTTVDDAIAGLGSSPVDVAYAVRWLELGGEPVEDGAFATR